MKAKYLKAICEVINGLRHRDYERTVKYAQLLTDLSTGRDEAASRLIKQVIRRETVDEHEMRKTASFLLCKPSFQGCVSPYNKSILRDNANISIDDKEKEIYDNFYGSTNLGKYLSDYYRPYSHTDPNAHLIISILPYDNNREKPRISPEIITAEDSLYFEYELNDLKMFVCKYGTGYKLFHKGSVDENGKLTDDCNGIVASPEEDGPSTDWREDIDYDGLVNGVAAGEKLYLKFGGKIYSFVEFEPKLKRIPVKRIGYNLDPLTNMRTCISPIDAALPRMQKTIAATSELDLTILLHVFAQKIQQTWACKGETNKPCSNGKVLGTEDVCKNCNGTGDEPIHKSAMDVITVRMGQRPEDDRNLANIIHYSKPDIETPKFLDEYVDKHNRLTFYDVFVQNPLSTTTVDAKTATEVTIDEGNMNIVIMPYVHQYEDIWEFAVHTAAEIKDIKEPKSSIKFPDDLTIKTLDQLLVDYKDSATMPSEVRKKIREKISRKIAIGDRKEEKRIAARILHEPFVDKTDTDARYCMSRGLVEKEKEVLWANYNEIMTEVEETHKENWVEFTYEKQRDIIMEVVKVKMGKLPQQQPLTFES